MLNKKESEDQAHVYIPTERKPKIEEPSPRRLGHGETFPTAAAPQNSEAKNVAIAEQPINQQDLMDIGSDVNGTDTTVDNESILKSTHKRNLDDNNIKAVESKKKPTLTDEDLKNFNDSISYVSKIYRHLTS